MNDRRDLVGSVTGRLYGHPVEIRIADHRIIEVAALPEAPPRTITPGLVDLQVNGYRGWDVNADDLDIDVLRGLAAALFEQGTTSFVPTVITASRDKILHNLSVIAAARRRDPILAHAIIGVHLEGPCLSDEPGARGAHPIDQLRDPDLAELDQWITAGDGLLRFLTIAPERPGALDLIRAAREAGITVAIGHTAAPAETIAAAVDAGATLSTHLGNGAPATLPRHPNLLWAQLAEDRLAIGVIADGHHLSAETLTVFLRAKTPQRTFLVSDSAALAGSPPGVYESPVGGTVEVTTSGRLQLPATGLLAGSGASLAECLDWAVRHLPFDRHQLQDMATVIPARIAGHRDRGTVRVGASADLVISDDETVTTLVGGIAVSRRNASTGGPAVDRRSRPF